MKDPEGIDDTDVGSGLSAEASDTDPVDVAPTETNDTRVEPFEPSAMEHDTEDFLRWLPTMWLGHRRQRELVHRRMSDGGDFVAYASTARPTKGSAGASQEASVQLQTGEETQSGAPATGRDAATVLKRPKGRKAKASLMAAMATLSALAMAYLALGWGQLRAPTSSEPALDKSRAVSAEAAKRVEQVCATALSTAPPWPSVASEDTASLKRPRSAASDAGGTAHARPGASAEGASRGRPPNPAASVPAKASARIAKDQYFEEP